MNVKDYAKTAFIGYLGYRTARGLMNLSELTIDAIKNRKNKTD